MKQYNSLLIVGLLSSSMSSFIASEDTQQSFIKSTKKDLRVASGLYAASYGILHGFGSLVFAPVYACSEAGCELLEAKRNGERIFFRKTVNTFRKEFKDVFFYENKEIFRSHGIMAPVMLGGVVAYNVHKKVNS